MQAFTGLFGDPGETPVRLGAQLCGILCALASMAHGFVTLSDRLSGRWTVVSWLELINGFLTLLGYLYWRLRTSAESVERTETSRWITGGLLLTLCVRFAAGWLLAEPSTLYIPLISGLLYLPLLLAAATLLALPRFIVVGTIAWMSLTPLTLSEFGASASDGISDWRIGPAIAAAYTVFYFFLVSTTMIIRQNRGLAQEATIDPLTGCLNRRGLSKMVEDIGTRNHSILLIDIDGFKQINDAHGHETGDQVLQTVAQLIRAAVRHSDQICRWGGDEFLVLMQNQESQHTRARGESIRRRIERETWRHLQIPDLRITVSIGVSSDARDLKSGAREADRALYRAKHAGRNRTMLADSDAPPG